MANKYYNINGENGITPMYCHAYKKLYEDIEGYEERFDLVYTKIIAETPDALDSAIIIGDYWTADPRGITKLEKSLSTTASNRFQLSYEPLDTSLKVYINGVPVPYTMHPSPGVFEVDVPQQDGYMWCEYIIDESNAGKVLGDTRTSIETVGGIITNVVYPLLDEGIIVMLRQIINNMEAYLEVIPTTWIGGLSNTVRSGPTNIIRTVTPIYADHIKELQAAVTRLEASLDTMIPVSLSRYYFSNVDYNDVLVVEYIEEIIQSIHSLERIILDPEYYGG